MKLSNATINNHNVYGNKKYIKIFKINQDIFSKRYESERLNRIKSDLEEMHRCYFRCKRIIYCKDE